MEVKGLIEGAIEREIIPYAFMSARMAFSSAEGSFETAKSFEGSLVSVESLTDTGSKLLVRVHAVNALGHHCVTGIKAPGAVIGLAGEAREAEGIGMRRHF